MSIRLVHSFAVVDVSKRGVVGKTQLAVSGSLTVVAQAVYLLALAGDHFTIIIKGKRGNRLMTLVPYQS